MEAITNQNVVTAVSDRLRHGEICLTISLPVNPVTVKQFRTESVKITFYDPIFMAENAYTQNRITPDFDPLIQTQNIAFTADQLIECSGCGRMNPPNRIKCLYCAFGLEIKSADASAVTPVLRKLEIWERGFNLIVRDAGNIQVDRAARFLSLDRDKIECILETGIPLPIARVESEKEALVIQGGLEKLGLRCSLVSDIDLVADKPHIRLSGLNITEDGFIFKAFNTGNETAVAFGDLALIVPGIITARRLDLLEKKGRDGTTKLLDETATASDETILDLYSKHDPTGFRIHLTGFDYSCLGEEKGLLATENMRRLIVFLKNKAPNAKIVNEYRAVRHALSTVWEIETRKDSTGLKRSGVGKVEFGSVSSTSNLNQFTKFSRLQWHLQ